jgi:hypothetical protein
MVVSRASGNHKRCGKPPKNVPHPHRSPQIQIKASPRRSRILLSSASLYSNCGGPRGGSPALVLRGLPAMKLQQTFRPDPDYCCRIAGGKGSGGQSLSEFVSKEGRKREAPRCSAKSKRTGQRCRAPAVRDWSICLKSL